MCRPKTGGGENGYTRLAYPWWESLATVKLEGFFDRQNGRKKEISIFGGSMGFMDISFVDNSKFFGAQRHTLTNQDEYLLKDNKHIHNGQQKGENY